MLPAQNVHKLKVVDPLLKTLLKEDEINARTKERLHPSTYKHMEKASYDLIIRLH